MSKREWNSSKRLTVFSLTKPIARSFLGFFVVVILALFVTPWQQTSRGSGRVIALSPSDRIQSISSPIDGRVTKWFVQEGTKVKEGDPIVQISDLDPQILINLGREREAIIKRFHATEKAATISKLNLDRQEKLLKEGLSSRRDYERAQVDYSNLLASEASASAEISKIDVRLARQETQLINSPRNGTIQAVFVGQGEVANVKSGDRLATLVPDSTNTSVELYIDGNDLPLIDVNRHVRLQFEGWPAVQFSGWPSVAVGTFGGKVSNIDPSDNGNGQFRVLVVPENPEDWPSQQYLRQGARAVGWILLGQVSAGFEVWRKLNGFPPSIQNKDKQTQESKKK